MNQITSNLEKLTTQLGVSTGNHENSYPELRLTPIASHDMTSYPHFYIPSIYPLW